MAAIPQFDFSVKDPGTAQLLAGLGRSFLGGLQGGRDMAAEDRKRKLEEQGLLADQEQAKGLLGALGLGVNQPSASPTGAGLSLVNSAAQRPVQFAETEEDVQRLEAQQMQPRAPVMAGGGRSMQNPALAQFLGTKEQEYGLPPGYLTRTAQIESGMNPSAKNPNSSAGGLFQFIDGTARQYGLADRFDPVQASDAAARLAADNKRILTQRLGREPTPGELYLAHQQGAGGASALLANPNARAVDVVGAKAVQLNGGDANMTAGQFASKWTGKFGPADTPAEGAMAAQFQPPGQASNTAVQLPPQARMLAEQTARMLQSDNPVLRARGIQQAQALIQQFGKQPGFQFQAVGDQLYRMDPRTGNVEPVQGVQKQMNPLDEEGKRLANEAKRAEIEERRSKLGQANSPTVQRIKQPDGSEVAVQWDAKSNAWVPLVAPQGGNPVANPKLTEQQSKDVGFYNRGQKLIPRLEQQDEALTGVIGSTLGQAPLVGNFVKPDAYQKAEQTGRELLAVILRKDTGAAVTDKEMELYGSIYLPKPGDTKDTIAQKRAARKTAIEGLKMGLGTAEILFRSQNPDTQAQGNQQPNRTKSGVTWSVVP